MRWSEEDTFLTKFPTYWFVFKNRKFTKYAVIKVPVPTRDSTHEPGPNIKMKLKSKVIRIIVYSKICILTQTHDDGKD